MPTTATATTPHRRSRLSAGLLMYRRHRHRVEVFIARPGGPWFPNRERDIWTIPKGEVEPGEEKLQAAIREFREEVGLIASPPYIELGWIRQKGGKTIFAWAFEGDFDESKPIRSNMVEIEWPPGSGRRKRWPEIVQAKFYGIDDAREHLKQAQHPLLDRLNAALHGTEGVQTGLASEFLGHPEVQRR